jgi:hypothetical protein
MCGPPGESIETVRARIVEVVGRITVPRKVLTWHTAIERLLKEDEKRRERQLAPSRKPEHRFCTALGYSSSSGRFCHSFTSSITASVTLEIRVGETSMPYISSKWPLVLPRRHAPRVHRDDLVVKTRPAGLGCFTAGPMSMFPT